MLDPLAHTLTREEYEAADHAALNVAEYGSVPGFVTNSATEDDEYYWWRRLEYRRAGRSWHYDRASAQYQARSTQPTATVSS